MDLAERLGIASRSEVYRDWQSTGRIEEQVNIVFETYPRIEDFIESLRELWKDIATRVAEGKATSYAGAKRQVTIERHKQMTRIKVTTNFSKLFVEPKPPQPVSAVTMIAALNAAEAADIASGKWRPKEQLPAVSATPEKAA